MVGGSVGGYEIGMEKGREEGGKLGREGVEWGGEDVVSGDGGRWSGVIEVGGTERVEGGLI